MKKPYIILLIAIAVIIVLLVSVYGYSKSQYYIKGQIDKANYCDVKEDCVDAGGKCPFGCYAHVNKNEVDRIKTLIDSYDSRCIYGCLYCGDVECVENRCEPVCDLPINQDSDSDSCVEDADCTLPGEYAIQSNCSV